MTNTYKDDVSRTENAICECDKDYGVYKEHGKIYCNKCGEEVIENNFPEDLETIIFRLTDEGWKEKSYSYYDGIHSVTLTKGKRKIRIEYDE